MPKKKRTKARIDNKIYMSYIEHYSGGQICEGEEDREFPEREPGNIDFMPQKLSTIEAMSQETLEVDFDPAEHIGDTVHVLYVVYTDGDTFGYTNGHWYVMGVFLDLEEAKKIGKDIQENRYKGYKPWAGYFSSFSGVEIWSTKLTDEEHTGITLL